MMKGFFQSSKIKINAEIEIQIIETILRETDKKLEIIATNPKDICIFSKICHIPQMILLIQINFPFLKSFGTTKCF